MIKSIVLLSLIISFSTCNANDVNYSYIEAVYKFYYKNLKAGEMFLKISKNDKNINISTTYKGNILASLANRDFREEISNSIIKGKEFYPKNYSFKDNKSSYKIIYNSNKEAKLIDEDSEGMELLIESESNIHDPLYLLVILMNKYPNVNSYYYTISKGRLKKYDYTYKDNQTMTINNKKFQGYSAKYTSPLIGSSGKKTNFYFFSEEHKNLMVYTSIFKNNKERLRIELSEIISIK